MVTEKHKNDNNSILCFVVLSTFPNPFPFRFYLLGTMWEVGDLGLMLEPVARPSLLHSSFHLSHICSFHVECGQAGEGRTISKYVLIQNNEAKNLRKQIHTNGIRTDFWACPLKSWFSASFFSNMNFLDEIQATQNISYIIQPPNFCWGEKKIHIHHLME